MAQAVRRNSQLIFTLAVTCSAAALMINFRSNLQAETALQSPTRDYAPLYLPDARYVRLITLGHDTLAGDLLWFNTNSYFGRQMREKRDVNWLGEMCKLITELDKRSPHYYEFCGTLLSWIAKDPQASNRILDSAIRHNPGNWKYRYLRGFNFWYFLEDKKQATEDFSAAAKLPGAPPILASLASRLMISTDDSTEAILLLRTLIQTTKDPAVRTALFDKLKRAQLSHDINVLNSALSIAQKQGRSIKSLEELVALGIITSLPADPFGGTYFLDLNTGAIGTTSGEKGLDFSGHNYSRLKSREATGQEPASGSDLANHGEPNKNGDPVINTEIQQHPADGSTNP